ncbi:MAG TPA: hypothetical protein PLE24_11085, partial [Chitinispirillaceae bacterium]|nr:hypothetical protein [Chitinispirillaceae bacterium]
KKVFQKAEHLAYTNAPSPLHHFCKSRDPVPQGYHLIHDPGIPFYPVISDIQSQGNDVRLVLVLKVLRYEDAAGLKLHRRTINMRRYILIL